MPSDSRGISKDYKVNLNSLAQAIFLNVTYQALCPLCQQMCPGPTYEATKGLSSWTRQSHTQVDDQTDHGRWKYWGRQIALWAGQCHLSMGWWDWWGSLRLLPSDYQNQQSFYSWLFISDFIYLTLFIGLYDLTLWSDFMIWLCMWCTIGVWCWCTVYTVYNRTFFQPFLHPCSIGISDFNLVLFS